MVTDNISHFVSTPASGMEAAVIKAPLQVGIGSYALFQQAVLAISPANEQNVRSEQSIRTIDPNNRSERRFLVF
ncbi:hypothetical protein BU23DRAFT_552030 [Bimuria novae-zelandiae CBS 107.79]|uniref:Uncharacterized protein n=1 Tax=Bimuria novae-zelandiae CBS 107.79 TaxID=1447943 RepID=A0A6A5VJX0_9PLEO|nr:hypothetical protein BU23DRAFT_552030 [Bimuria novae-zelandiae CBS 107.79]